MCANLLGRTSTEALLLLIDLVFLFVLLRTIFIRVRGTAWLLFTYPTVCRRGALSVNVALVTMVVATTVRAVQRRDRVISTMADVRHGHGAGLYRVRRQLQ